MELVEDGKLSLSLARTVLEIPGDEVRSVVAHEIVDKDLTVREAQNLIKRLQKPPKPLPEVPEIDYLAEVEKNPDIFSRKKGQDSQRQKEGQNRDRILR